MLNRTFRTGACMAVLAAGPFFAVSVQAQNTDATRSYDQSQPGSQNIRNFTVRNESGETIEWAEVGLTDGSKRLLTDKRPLTNAHSQPVGAPGKACLDEVHVRFKGGWKVDAVGLNACLVSTVSILRDQVVTKTSARPGP